MSLPTPSPGDRVLEITRDATGEVAHRSIVTGWPERRIDKLANGMSINLDHNHWSIIDRTVDDLRVCETPDDLPSSPDA
jgi:hypothetical protein